MARLNYKKQTAILVDFIEHLVEAGQQLYGEANEAQVPYDAPGSAAWRNEVSLVQLGVLSRPDLRELAAEHKRAKAADRPNWMRYQDEGGVRPRPGRPIGDGDG